jgi:aryl-alcohol dehydrogenase-like predicted oxidoreductase
MHYRTLGKTGLRVSVLGLGTGTRFGDPTRSQESLTRLVRGALDLGVNYIDTAAMYLEAETRLGVALAGVPRERFVLATKFFPADQTTGAPITAAQLRASVDNSLRQLRLETVDVLQVHGLRPSWLAPVMEKLGDELSMLQQEGKFRFLGVAETIVEDPLHEMLPAAAATGRFDQALVGYNLLSPWAEESALPACARAGIGAVGMVAVRQALRDPALLTRVIRAAKARGEIAVRDLPDENPLDWLLDGFCPTVPAIAYRFAIAHPAIASVLSGTLNLDHLRDNLAAVTAPPMSPEQLTRVRAIWLQTNPRQWILYNL